MSSRRTLILLLAAFTASAAFSYTVIRKDGGKFETKEPPTYKDGKVIFVLPGGSKGSMPESSINKKATEAANRVDQKPAKKKSVATNESLSKSEKDTKKTVFTNNDLANAKGVSTMEGNVTFDAGDDKEWARKHDEEMAKLRGEKPTSDVESGQKTPKAEPSPVEKAQKKVDELRAKLAELDRTLANSAGDAVTINQRLQTVADLKAAEEDLARLRGGGSNED